VSTSTEDIRRPIHSGSVASIRRADDDALASLRRAIVAYGLCLQNGPRDGAPPGQAADELKRRVESLSALMISRRDEIDRLREKNRELNRRAQAADAAFRDAKAVVDRGVQEGSIKFVRGSLGRAMLGYHATTLESQLLAFKAALDRSPFDISPCMQCGQPVVCLPDGMPCCEACGDGGGE
jgi:hypothetical protein